jgi:predicted permease
MEGALTESRTDLWLPMVPLREAEGGELRRGRSSVIARVKSGVPYEAAEADLRLIARRVEEEANAGTPYRVGVRLAAFADEVTAPVRASLWMLFAAVGLVLLATCANVANLLLARMSARSREVLIRSALGAGRFRLARQFLAESLMLSLASGLLGVLVARGTLSLLLALGSARIPRAHEVSLDWRAFAFLLVACTGTALLFGLAPSITAARMNVASALRDAGSAVTTGRSQGRIRDGLVIAEVALAFVLGIGAAMLMREVARLRDIDSGMDTANVLTLHLTPRAAPEDYVAIDDRVGRLPGVDAAGFTQLVPLQNWGWDAEFSIEGRPDDERRVVGLRYVTPGYFRALGIPLVNGRMFGERDHAEAPMALLINEAAARRFFPGEDPVGVVLDRGTIVGVVGDVRQVGLDRPADADLYYAVPQNVTMASDIGMTLLVRTAPGTAPLIEPIRAAVREVNPGLALSNIRTMDRVLADSMSDISLYRWLIGMFAALALGLALIGLYGVISFSVSSRMREIAVRRALGSDALRLARLVFARGARLCGAGIAAGIGIALLTTPALSRLSVRAGGDASTYAAVVLILLALTITACLLPAARAAAVDPATVLRHD